MKRFLGVVLLFLTICSARADVTHDFSSWSAIFIQGGLSSKFGYFFESQSRVNQNVNSGNRILIRPALRYFLTPDFVLWLGYGWVPNFTPFKNEHRIWEQATFVQNFDFWQISHRFRVEQRLIDGAPESAHRLRYLLKGLKFFDEKKTIALSVWDEFFYHLNTVTGLISAGFDQNRVFLGFHFKLAESVRFEPGYMNVYTSRPTLSSDLMTHALTSYFFLNL